MGQLPIPVAGSPMFAQNIKVDRKWKGLLHILSKVCINFCNLLYPKRTHQKWHIKNLNDVILKGKKITTKVIERFWIFLTFLKL